MIFPKKEVPQPEPLIQMNNFKGDQRWYATPKGNYPSITTVLGETADSSWLESWKDRVGVAEATAISKSSTDVGTDLHSLAEAYVLGLPAPSIKHNLAKIMFPSLKAKLDKHLTNYSFCEVQMKSDVLRIAGTSDLICAWDMIPTIADYKSNHKLGSLKKDEWITDYKLQACGYAQMYYEHTGVKITQGVILICNGFSCQDVVFNPYDYFAELVKRCRMFHENLDKK